MGRVRLPEHVRRLIPEVASPKKHGAKRPRPAHWPPGVDSDLELQLYTRLERHGLPLGEGQAAIVPGRQYRFDRVWRAQKVAVEVQGGIWIQGAHSRGSGVARDCMKVSIAAALGWRVLLLTDKMIQEGQAVRLIARALGLPRPR